MNKFIVLAKRCGGVADTLIDAKGVQKIFIALNQYYYKIFIKIKYIADGVVYLMIHIIYKYFIIPRDIWNGTFIA